MKGGEARPAGAGGPPSGLPDGFAPKLISFCEELRKEDVAIGTSEILDAFESTYGEHIRMAPPKRGFNLVGWLTPFAALLIGAIGVLFLLRSWRRPVTVGAPADVTPIRVSASEEELARLDAAVRRDDA